MICSLCDNFDMICSKMNLHVTKSTEGRRKWNNFMMLQKSGYNYNEWIKSPRRTSFCLFMWIFMAVGECSVLVSCPVDISQVARGATWRHRDGRRGGGYRPLCTLIQHRPMLLCDDSWRASSVWLEPLMPPHSWRRVSLGATARCFSCLEPPSVSMLPGRWPLVIFILVVVALVRRLLSRKQLHYHGNECDLGARVVKFPSLSNVKTPWSQDKHLV